MKRQFNGQRVVFSKNGAKTIGYPKRTMIHILYHIQKLTQNGSDLNVKLKTVSRRKLEIGKNFLDAKAQ